MNKYTVHLKLRRGETEPPVIPIEADAFYRSENKRLIFQNSKEIKGKWLFGTYTKYIQFTTVAEFNMDSIDYILKS